MSTRPTKLLNALTDNRVLLMDGAMGTELWRQDPQQAFGFERWNLTHPERVRAVHRAYVQAGAEVLVANTFQANAASHPDDLERVIEAAIALAREEAGGRLVLASVGPFAAADESALERLFVACAAADGLLLETWSELPPLPDASGLPPVLLSLTFWRRPDGQIVTIRDETPEVMAAQVNRLPIAALGVNCGRDLDLSAIGEVLRRYRQETDLPLLARPNAGTPSDTVYPLTAEKMAEGMSDLLACDVKLIGGCCGTTPAHIAAMHCVIGEPEA